MGAQLPEALFGVVSYKKQIACRQWPDGLPIIIPADNADGIGLFQVTAQLGKNLAPTDTHRDGQAGLAGDALPDSMGQGDGVTAEKMKAAGHIEIAFIDAEALHLTGVLLVDGVDLFTILLIQVMAGRAQHEVRAFSLGLPYGFRCFNSIAFWPAHFWPI